MGGSSRLSKKLWDNGILSLFGRETAAEPRKFFTCHLLCRKFIHVIYSSEFPNTILAHSTPAEGQWSTFRVATALLFRKFWNLNGLNKSFSPFSAVRNGFNGQRVGGWVRRTSQKSFGGRSELFRRPIPLARSFVLTWANCWFHLEWGCCSILWGTNWSKNKTSPETLLYIVKTQNISFGVTSCDQLVKNSKILKHLLSKTSFNFVSEQFCKIINLVKHDNLSSETSFKDPSEKKMFRRNITNLLLDFMNVITCISINNLVKLS